MQGPLDVDGNKNAALPLIASAILFSHTIVLSRIPQILDVKNMCEILTHMKANILDFGTRLLYLINTANLDPTRIHRDGLGRSTCGHSICRADFMTLWQVEFPTPGGDVIGRRRLDTHFLAFQRDGRRQ